jgi:hypothetical protein
MIFAERAISGGPPDIARSIFASVVSLEFIAARPWEDFASAPLPNLAPMTTTTAIAATNAAALAVERFMIAPFLLALRFSTAPSVRFLRSLGNLLRFQLEVT